MEKARAIEKRQNRLSGESSPYLLQHADNPVDWYSWGEEAFERAAAEDKPVFLSIGYATCHWCHVMERESFEDAEVAALMNETFVSIKVDREERPDIDHIYMTVCQLMTGGGGWPLTIVMTPDKRPFFAATYIPKTARFGRKGMTELIPAIRRVWNENRGDIRRSADEISAALARAGHTGTPGDIKPPGEVAMALGYRQLKAGFDARNGGFGTGMKFPTPHQLMFLLRYYARTRTPAALDMVEKTLTAMRQGGIYDHIGFGFHRYSTDPEWRVPHFEKMLYDQALLLIAYLEGYQATGKPAYKETAREIATYVLRDMTSPLGGFYSAEDADSEGVEGRFYTWTTEALRQSLDSAAFDLVAERFDLREEGNFDDGEEMSAGRNVLIARAPLETVAGRLGLSPEETARRSETARRVLFETREGRIHPLKDDKVLTDWNGLMMGALARAGRVLGDADLVAAARRNAAFIRERLTGADGRLLHRFRDGNAGLPAHLDDYAFVAFGLLELYEATFDPAYLAEALRLTGVMLEHFADAEGGALFLTSDDAETILVRAKELYDGALPAGNSVALGNLLRLHQMTGRPALERAARHIAAGFARDAGQRPIGHTMFLCGLDFAVGPSVEVVIAGKREAEDTREMVRALERRFLPNKVVLLRDEQCLPALEAIAPFVAHQPQRDDRATAYVCVDHACSTPTTDPEEMVRKITAYVRPE